jgi:hypothetical protein
MINNKNKSKIIFKGKRILRNNLNNKTNSGNDNTSDLSDIFSSPINAGDNKTYQGFDNVNQMQMPQMNQMQMPQMNQMQMPQMNQMQMPQMNQMQMPQMNMLQNLAQLSNIPNFQNIDPLMINIGGPMIPQSNLPGMDSNYFQQQVNGFQGLGNAGLQQDQFNANNFMGQQLAQPTQIPQPTQSLPTQMPQLSQMPQPSYNGTSLLQNLSKLNNQIPQFN